MNGKIKTATRPITRSLIPSLFVVFFGTANLAAVPVIDQEQLILGRGGINFGGVSQVVTAGVSGLLVEVRLPVQCVVGGFFVQIQGVTGGTPNGVVLTSQPHVEDGMLFPFERIVLSTPVFFAVGDRFAIVLLTFPGSCQFLAGPIGDSYSGGDAFFDAPPNPTGWVRICDSPNGRCDLPFQTLVETLSEEVSIDIKPGSDPNSINCRHNGVIPVAILTTSDFDATTVDPSTVALGLGGATLIHRRAHIQDVDGDGDLDMVLHFRQQDTEIVCGDEEACLTGETTDGTPIEGCDAIRTVGGPRR